MFVGRKGEVSFVDFVWGGIPPSAALGAAGGEARMASCRYLNKSAKDVFSALVSKGQCHTVPVHKSMDKLGRQKPETVIVAIRLPSNDAIVPIRKTPPIPADPSAESPELWAKVEFCQIHTLLSLRCKESEQEDAFGRSQRRTQN